MKHTIIVICLAVLWGYMLGWFTKPRTVYEVGFGPKDWVTTVLAKERGKGTDWTIVKTNSEGWGWIKVQIP